MGGVDSGVAERDARQRGFDSFVPSAAVSIGLTLKATA